MNKDLIVGTNRDLSATLSAYEEQIARGLPKDIPFGKVLNFALTAVVNTPALRQCTQASFIKALIESVMMGLEPNTPLEQAYLIPYGNTVKLMPSYKGLITLAYNTGRVDVLYAHNVFSGDLFQSRLGTDPNVEHSPDYEAERNLDSFRCCYAVCFMKDSRIPIYEVMTKKDIDLIKAKSQTQKVWGPHYFEMAKKTVLKRICKILPRASESHYLSQAISLDNQLETGKTQIFQADLTGFEDLNNLASPEPGDG